MKNPVIVWRLENQEGKGCYSSLETKKFLAHHNEDIHWNHPTPYLDRGIFRDRRPGEISCFKTLEQVLNWFSVVDLIRLRSLGYVLKRIHAFITAEGEKQILAIKAEEIDYGNNRFWVVAAEIEENKQKNKMQNLQMFNYT